jgi:hypothetical protein
MLLIGFSQVVFIRRKLQCISKGLYGELAHFKAIFKWQKVSLHCMLVNRYQNQLIKKIVCWVAMAKRE